MQIRIQIELLVLSPVNRITIKKSWLIPIVKQLRKHLHSYQYQHVVVNLRVFIVDYIVYVRRAGAMLVLCE